MVVHVVPDERNVIVLSRPPPAMGHGRIPVLSPPPAVLSCHSVIRQRIMRPYDTRLWTVKMRRLFSSAVYPYKSDFALIGLPYPSLTKGKKLT